MCVCVCTDTHICRKKGMIRDVLKTERVETKCNSQEMQYTKMGGGGALIVKEKKKILA